MQDQNFDMDLVLEPQRSARLAWRVATASCVLSGLLGIGIITLLPLKETEVFTVLVDRTTGAAERIVQVQPTNISDEEAVKESLLVAYVTDRESYIRSGIQERLESVQRRSTDSARATLQQLWTDNSDNENYPPRVYGAGAQVSVQVKAINFLNDNVAQVRFEKTLTRQQQRAVTRSFVATVEFEFSPRQERRLQRVWENPLGFSVSTFKIDAETLGE